MIDDFPHVQIRHITTGITYIRRAIPREEMRQSIEFSLLKNAMSGIPHSVRDKLKGYIVTRIMDYLEQNHIEFYRQLPYPPHRTPPLRHE